MTRESDRAGQVALVLTAGGARGAYQAGVIAELLPMLDGMGMVPTVLVGESVGALNAAVLASVAHLPVGRRVAALLEHWAAVDRPGVLRPLWQQLPLVLMRYGGETLGLRNLRLQGLLGTEPLRDTLDALLDWPGVHRNVADGTVDTVAVAATTVATGRTLVFVERDGPCPDGTEELRYRSVALDTAHVMGSGAIPVLFPPVWIDTPPQDAAWYVDGSTRLHTPLRPALDLGADRVVAVGTSSLHRRVRMDDTHAVDLGDAAVTLLNAMVEDPLREDLRRLEAINAHLVGEGPQYEAVHRYRAARGRPAYRRVPYIAIAPEEPDEIAGVAIDVFNRRYRGLRSLRDPDFEAIYRLLGGPSPMQGEVLSYVLFDQAFFDELIRMGRRDAQRWLEDNGADPFRDGPAA